MSNPDLAYDEILTGHYEDDYDYWSYEYNKSKWSFLQKDHLETALWLIKYGCLSSWDIWYRLIRNKKFYAKKVAEYLAEEPNQEHRKLQLNKLVTSRSYQAR